MAILTDIYALSRAYPLLSAIAGLILFFIGLKVTVKIIKWILWALAAAAVIAALVLLMM